MGLSLPSFLLLTAASLHVAVGGPQCDPRNVTTSSALGLMAALLTDYDQQRPPEQPTSIGLLMEINDIFTIDTRKDAFWLDMVLHARWVDCRLAYDPARNEGVEWVKWPRDIWQPDWKVSGLRETIFEQARWAVLSRPDGLVYMSAKFPAKYKCTMDLSLLPFDTQTCNWTVSTSWPSQYVRLEMWEPVAQGAPKIEELHSTSGDFGLQLHPVSNREWLFANLTTKRVEFYNVGLHKPSDGARLQFTIHRRHYWYTVNIVIPSMFMWVINYSSLYMSPDAAPARVALAVLPILILISLSSRVFSSIPIISTSTWLTDYIFVLEGLCSVNMLEYVALHACLRVAKARAAHGKAMEKKHDRGQIELHAIEAEGGSAERAEGPGMPSTLEAVASALIHGGCHLDPIFRVLALLGFLIVTIAWYSQI